MKDSRTTWVTLLRLVLALSDAIVLEQIELLDFQKSQRLCMYLCVMDLNGYSMLWDPQWFDSLGHFLPSHRYAFCALPSAILSVHLDAIHFAFPTTLSLPRWVMHWVHVWGKKKLPWKSTRRAELPLRETEIPSSRAQGSGFKIRLVMGDFGVSGSIKGIKILLLLSWVLFLFLVEHLDMNAGIWLRKLFALFLFLFIYLVLYLPFRSVLEQRTAALPSTYQFWSILLNQGGFVSHLFPPSFSHKEAEAEEARELERNTLKSFKEERSMTVVSIICCWHCHQLKNLVKPGEVCVIPHPSPTR